MSLSTTANKVILSGNGATTAWPFTFPIPDATYLSVIYTDTAGVETTLSTSLYSVTGIGTTTGGSVTYPISGTPIATGTTLTLLRTAPYTQPTILGNQGGYYPEVVEAVFDRITMEIQQLAEKIARALVAPVSDPTAPGALPSATARANTVLGFDSSGNPYAATLTTSIVSVTAWLVANFLNAATSAQAACAALLAAYLPGTNAFTGSNTFSGDLAGISPVRQTVAVGPVDTSGFPSFLPATATGLTLTSQNLSSTYPLTATAPNGISGDRRSKSASNLSWTALTNTTTNYLYVTVNADGTLTTGFTTTAPVYQWGGTPAVTSGLFTFNIAEMRGYLGNGVTAPQAYIVFVGEAVTSGGNITSTIAYAYNGKYDSGFTATLPAAATVVSKSHKVGVADLTFDVVIECTSAEQNYAVGSRLVLGKSVWTNGSGVFQPPAIYTSATVLSFTGGTDASTWMVINATTGGGTNVLTLAKWKYKALVSRSW